MFGFLKKFFPSPNSTANDVTEFSHAQVATEFSQRKNEKNLTERKSSKTPAPLTPAQQSAIKRIEEGRIEHSADRKTNSSDIHQEQTSSTLAKPLSHEKSPNNREI
jgi:hypothetical protein